MRTATLILLLYLGFQRGYWKTWDQTPPLMANPEESEALPAPTDPPASVAAGPPQAAPEAEDAPAAAEDDIMADMKKRKMSTGTARAELRKRKADAGSQFKPLGIRANL